MRALPFRPQLLAILALALAARAASAQDPAELQLAARAFRAATAKVLPALVTIETYGGGTEVKVNKTPAPMLGGRAPRIGVISRPGEGPGSGVILSADGFIVTSTFNFIGNPPVIAVTLHDGTRHVAKLCGRDELRGVCVLKIDDVKNLAVPEFVPRKMLRVGQWAISMGVGYGEGTPAISAGIVSALHRLSGLAVQTDANLSPANYGGPLVDIEGRVIGICTAATPHGEGPTAGVAWYDSGIGFAIPLAPDTPFVVALKEGKSVKPGRLGILPKLKSDGEGVVLEKVLKDSAAEKAGLAAGDRILAVNGRPVRDAQLLRTALRAYAGGESIEIKYRRGQEERTCTVKLDAGDEAAKKG